MMEVKKRIPVTILSGFLGSGKTTLLNEIIQQNPETKFAIIENEFGEIGIDQDLVIKKDESIFEMSNGCICCSINNELVESLFKLASDEYQFDHLLIETTGIAEPLGVAEAFLGDPVIQQKFLVNGIICLVDSEYAEDVIKEEEEAGKQIAAADLIIFNKADLVHDDYLASLEKIIKEINPYADILITSHAKTDTKALLNMQAFDSKKIQEKHKEVAHDHHHHHHHLSTCSFTFEKDFDFQKFYQWASVLLAFQSGRIYRVKGILSFKGEREKAIFQSVQTRFLLTKGEEWQDGEERNSRIVFIGKELQQKRLQRHLEQCLYKG